MSELLPSYDRWLDEPYQREMDARAEDEDEEADEVEEDEGDQ